MKPPATAQRGNQPQGITTPKSGGGSASEPETASEGSDVSRVEYNPQATPVPNTMFGSALEPVLLKECQGKLSSVSWFRTDWQRGGALTGYATWRDQKNQSHEVVVKLPVPPRERDWLVRLGENQSVDAVTPRVFANGDALNGYDMAWVVMERLPHGPLGAAWEGREFDMLVESVAKFYAAADRTPLPQQQDSEHRDWEELLRISRDKVKDKRWPNGQAWKKALKQAGKKLDRWLHDWHQRARTGWCHGDLHLGNALSRVSHEHQNENDAVLIDLANVRPGHWVEDAVYCEHLYWAVPHRLAGRKLVSMLAKARKTHGLPVGDDWSQLADIKRNLLAMASPATISHHGGGKPQLDAALSRLG